MIEAETCSRGGAWELENWGGYSGAYAVKVASSVESELECTVTVPDGSEGTVAVWSYRDTSSSTVARYRIDGGDWTTFSTAGAPGIAQVATTPTLAAGVHVLTFSNSANSMLLVLDNLTLNSSSVASTTSSSSSSTTSSSTTTTTEPTTTTTSTPGVEAPTETDPEAGFVLGMLAMVTAGGLLASVLVPKP